MSTQVGWVNRVVMHLVVVISGRWCPQGPPPIISIASTFNSSSVAYQSCHCRLRAGVARAIYHVVGVVSTPWRCHVTLHAYQEPLKERQGTSSMVSNRIIPNSPLHDLPLPLAGQDTRLNTIIG
jgi:hypothetical protein